MKNDEDWGFVCLPSSALDSGWMMWTIGTGQDIFSTTYVNKEASSGEFGGEHGCVVVKV